MTPRFSFPAAVLGALALLGVLVLAAFMPAPGSANLSVLLILGLAALAVWAPFGRRLYDDNDAAIWLLFVVAASVYSLARQAGPREGFALHLSLLPGSPVVAPYATRLVLLGAVLSAPAWLSNLSAPVKALLSAAGLIAILGVVSLLYLRPFYPVSEVSVDSGAYVDPHPLVDTLMQCLEYAALGLCCAGASAHPVVRKATLRALPLLLLVWVRHVLKPVPIPAEDQ